MANKSFEVTEPEEKTRFIETQSKWARAIIPELNMRAVVIHAKDLVQSQIKLHRLKSDSAIRFGESLLGALFLGSILKENQKLNLRIEGLSEGHSKVAFCDVKPEGRVRGYFVSKTAVDQDSKIVNSKKSKSLGPWGEGSISILRTSEVEGNVPYTGTVPLLTGHLAKDLTFYWHQSEQVPSALGMVVEVKNNKVEMASGFLVQALPGTSIKELGMIEDRINALREGAKDALNESNPIMTSLAKIFHNEKINVLEEQALSTFCSCSNEKVANALNFLTKDDFDDILANEKKIEVKCDFCLTDYSFDEAQVRKLAAKK